MFFTNQQDCNCDGCFKTSYSDTVALSDGTIKKHQQSCSDMVRESVNLTDNKCKSLSNDDFITSYHHLKAISAHARSVEDELEVTPDFKNRLLSLTSSTPGHRKSPGCQDCRIEEM